MGIETPTSCMGADHNWKNFLGGFFERTKNPQRIRSGQSDSCPPKLFAKIGKVRGELIRTLLTAWRTFSVFFETKKSSALLRTCGRSAANPWRIFGSAADSCWVCSRSAWVSAKSTPGGSAGGPLEVCTVTSGSAAGLQRTRVCPFNSQLMCF